MDQTPDVTAPDSQADLPEQMRVRRDKRDRLLAAGSDALPGRGSTHPHPRAGARAVGAPGDGRGDPDVVGVAGRVVFIRNTGKLAFATLQEGIGHPAAGHAQPRRGRRGGAGRWKSRRRPRRPRLRRGPGHLQPRAVSCRCWRAGWQMASKALRPLPVLHKELSEETRVRQRYADLVVRQEARDMVRTKASRAARPSGRPSTTRATSRSRRRSSSSCTAAPRPARSAPT